MSHEDWFENLENSVLDENKTVTFKVLSKELNIPVNVAKQYLTKFVNVQNSKGDVALKTTYFLSGFLEIDGIKFRKAQIVAGDALEKTKESLLEVTSCHVYSVGTALLDDCALYTIDQHCNINTHEYSNLMPIKNSNIEISAPRLTKGQLKADAKPLNSLLPKKDSSKNDSTSIAQKIAKSPVKSTNSTMEHKKAEENVASKKQDTEPKKSKPNALASMWQKSEEKQKSGSSSSDGKGKSKSPKKNKQAVQKNNIMSMFSRQAVKNAENGGKQASAQTQSVAKKAETPVETVGDSESSLSKVTTKTASKPSTSTKRKSSHRSSKKSSSGDKSDEDFKPTKKKHRRICTFDDSDSESESEEALDKAQRNLLSSEEAVNESPIPGTPAATPDSYDSEEPIPPTPPLIVAKGKKKMWKNVQKTYQDEDGFFVTKQEKVLVSESDDEDPVPSKTSPKEVKKLNMFTNKKQASLTSFFKQK